jgi:hypothetical protein
VFAGLHPFDKLPRQHRPKRLDSRFAPFDRALSGRRVHSISIFLSLLAVRVARDERQEIVQRHGEITPGAALCIVVECAAGISEPGLFDR